MAKKDNRTRLRRFGCVNGLLFENGASVEIAMESSEILRILLAWEATEFRKKNKDEEVMEALSLLRARSDEAPRLIAEVPIAATDRVTFEPDFAYERFFPATQNEKRQDVESWYDEMLSTVEHLPPAERRRFYKWDSNRPDGMATSDWPGFEKILRPAPWKTKIRDTKRV